MNKKRLLLFPILLVICVIPLFFFTSRISTDIKVLLPRDKWIENHLNFLRNSQIGTVIAISIEADKAQNATKLAEFTEKLTPQFTRMPGVTGVLGKVETKESMAVAGILFKHIPQILQENDYGTIIDKRIKVANLKSILRRHYEALLRPGGLFRQKMIAADPLNLHQIPLERLQNLGKNSGFKFKIRNSRLFSNDDRHILILIYTDIPVTNPEKAETLHNEINKAIDAVLPKRGYSHLVMSGHRHAIDNRKLLEHDILITLTVAGIGFFLLFALFFRDWKAFFVFIIPIVGMICAVGLTLTFFREPSAIILGLGATVIGIALDYGIHVFVAAKHTGNERQKALKNIRRPLIFSALTTLGVFWAFFFSGTPGYQQLAFASTCGVTLSLIFSIYCLPEMLPSRETKVISAHFLKFPKYERPKAFLILLIWFVFAGLAVASIHLTGFESDIRKLDGISRQLKEDEAKFHKIWGKNTQAAISVKANNLETAMQTQDDIADYAFKNQIPGFQSLSLVWPSRASRGKNAAFWDNYWQSGKEDLLRENLKTAGKGFGFSPPAFKAFFDNLYQHNFNKNLLENSDFAIFTKKFINYEQDGVRVSAFFSDQPYTVERMKYNCPGEIISPASFGTYISTHIIKDASHIAVIAFLLVLLLAFICLKSLAKTAVAMVPVFSAILIILPVFALVGMKINAVALVACIVVTGLAIDYGIFVVSACNKEEQVFAKDSFMALTLSVLSTAIGAAALLFAGHPALRSVGLVISSGVIAGYLGAIFVSPALYRMICQKPSQNQ